MNKTVYLAVLNFLVAWVCFRDVASAAILHRPLNLAVRSGEPIEMKCRWERSISPSEEDPIDWYHTPVGGTEQKINNEYRIVNAIFNGTTLNGDVTGQRLMVPSAQKQHAGLYTCTQTVLGINGSSSTMDRAEAQLVVLAADPVCEMRSSSTQIENGVFEVYCILSYVGSLAPVMRWRLANGNDKSKERALSVTQTDGMSKFTIVADSSLHGCRFICETVFNVSSAASDSRVADNIPSYNYTWKSSYIEVIYGPRKLSVVPAGDVFYPDDRLTCTADGNPNPSILWLNMESKDVTVGPTITIVDSMTRDQPYEFLCRARNPTTNQTQEIQIGFTVKQRCLTNSDSTILKILLVVTLAVSAVIIASLSVYIAVTKRKRWGNSRALPIASGGAFDAVNTKTPLSRVTRRNLSLPLPTVKHPPFDYTDYLSPSPRPPSVDYDEIPDSQAATAQNVVYLEFEPETSDQPASEFSRHLNEYLASSDALAKTKVYETLKHREN